jgi:spermidine/putrescine transport system ATP-binding protein
LKKLSPGDRAILFVRPELLRLGNGTADSTLKSTVLNVAFEGNASHVFLKGAGSKDITLTVGRFADVRIPPQGETAHISYDPAMALVLPEGEMARE